LAVACVIAMAYALVRGELWSAALCAFFGVFLMASYRRDKQMLERQP